MMRELDSVGRGRGSRCVHSVAATLGEENENSTPQKTMMVVRSVRCGAAGEVDEAVCRANGGGIEFMT